MKVTCEELIPNGKLSGRLSLSTFSYPHDLHTESNMTRNGSRVTCFCYCDSRIFSYPKLSSSAEFWKPSLLNLLSLRFPSLLPDFNLFLRSRRPFLLVQTSTQKSLSSLSVLFSAVTFLPYPLLFQIHLAVWFSCAVALYLSSLCCFLLTVVPTFLWFSSVPFLIPLYPSVSHHQSLYSP